MLRHNFTNKTIITLVMLFLLIISSCSAIRPIDEEYVELPGTGDTAVYIPKSQAEAMTGGKLFGDSGIPLLGRSDENTGGGGIGINVYLWRASLDTTSYMPLLSADPYGGVIITDWYSPEETPRERFKMTVYILDQKLRADGVKISLFKQILSKENQWRDTKPNPQTIMKIEDTILTKARQLRITSLRTK